MTEEVAPGVGEILARARQEQGLALADVAQSLRFAPRHLEALEQERFEALPGPTIARGMVRNYARLLKLDPEPLVQRIAERLHTPDAGELAARFRQPIPFSDSGRRSTVLYLLLSGGVLGLVGAVAYEWHNESSVPPTATVPARPAPVIAAQSVGAERHAAVASVAEPSAAPAPQRPEARAEPRIEQKAEPRIERPKAPEKPAEKVAAKMAEQPIDAPIDTAKESESALALKMSEHRIVLRCEEESWIEVKDANNRLLTSSLNPAGSERVIEGRPPFTLVIGNAPHVRVRYNDRPVDLAPHTKVEVARFTLK